MPGVILKGPDGREEFFGPDEVDGALASGYTARGGDTASLRQPSGSTQTVAVGDVGAVAAPGTTGVDTASRLGKLQGQWDDSEYGGFGGGVAATALGAARGATFGLSDLLVDDETAAGYSRENPGLDLFGNIAGGFGISSVGGLAKGAMAVGTKLAPGSKAAAAMLGGGLEGMAFGAGQATSAIILKNEPLTAESVFAEYGTGIFLGAGFGAAGGALGHGLERAGSALKARGAGKLDDAERILAANADSPTAIPLDSERGRVLTEDFVGGIDQSVKVADELAEEVARRPVLGVDDVVESAPVAAAEPPLASAADPVVPPAAPEAPAKPKTFADLPDDAFVKNYTVGSIVNQLDTNAITLTQDATLLGDKALAPHIRKVKATKSKLNKLINEELPEAASGPNAQTVGTGARKGRGKLYGPEMVEGLDIPAAKQVLQEYSDSIDNLARAMGNDPIPVQIGDDADMVAAVTKGARETKEQFAQSIDDIVAGKPSAPAPTAASAGEAKAARVGNHTPEVADRLKYVEKHVNRLQAALPDNDEATAYLKSLKTSLGLAAESDTPAVAKLLDQAEARLTKTYDGYAPFEGPKPRPAPIAPEVKALATEYAAAKQTLLDALWVRDGSVAAKRTVKVLAELPFEELSNVANAYTTFIKNGKALGDALGGDFATKAAQLTQQLERTMSGLKNLVGPKAGTAGIETKQVLVALGMYETLDMVPDFEGPADDIVKLWIASRALGGVPGGGSASSFVQRWFGNTAGRIGYRVGAQGGGAVVGGLKGSATATAARWGVDQILGSTGALAKSTHRAVGHAEAVVGTMLKGAGKAARRAAPFAPQAFLKSVRYADIEHPEGTSEFDRRAREIRMNVANSMGMQHTVLRNLGEMAMHHPGVADKIVAQADRTMKFLQAKLPRDPGTVMRLGRSGWRASTQDQAKFARFARAAADPDGELMRFAEGDLSVEGAETLRTLYPAKFAKFQEYIAQNLTQLADKLSYPEQVQMSILFAVPVTSLMRPEVIKQVQANFAADASSDPISAPPPGSSGPTPLSPAQQLLTR